MYRINNWIIDADIARAAGTTVNPISKNCRDFLDFVRTSGHNFSADKKTREEWATHQSTYSKLWFSSMVARKKIVFVQNTIDVNTKINLAPVTEKTKEIALKDSHLVQTSLEHQAVIASGDNNAKNAFCMISQTYGRIRGLVWINPKDNFPQVHQKIIQRQSHEDDWQII